MIHYNLRCDKAHAFESWFADSTAFDRQAKRGLVTCPICGSAKVEKAIMAPRLGNGRRGKTVAPQAPEGEDRQVTVLSALDKQLRSQIKELHDFVASHSDDVGERFPDEARKMQHGDIEHRPIHGKASVDEARALLEEGVDVVPLPALPDQRN